jgi:hypothetical protein
MKQNKLIAMSAPVAITAAVSEGEAKSPPKFTAEFYTGGALEVNGWDLPVVIDLAGLENGKVLVANLDHDSSKRVGNFAVANDGKSLVANGTASARTAARDEVVGSAEEGYQWQASLEVTPKQVEAVKAGKTVEVNGQSLQGPLYVTRKGVLKGFAFVSHGADDNTTVSIAAIAASHKESDMDEKFQAWVEAMGFDTKDLTADQLAGLQANYDGKNPPKAKKQSLKAGIEAQQAEADRIAEITEYALKACEKRQYEPNAREIIASINTLAEQAIEEKWTLDKFRLELIEAGLPMGHTVRGSGRTGDKLNNKVIEAAIALTGKLENVEKHFDEQTLDAADKHFKHGIGLNQLILLAAEANGYRSSYGGQVTLEAQRAAFGQLGPQQIRAGMFSTIEISTIISNNANKYLMEGWNSVEQTAMRLASVRPVRNFLQTSTVSLVGSDTMFEKLGAAGEIKHGKLGEVVYNNKADTYAKMLAITRQDIINDDLGALTGAPRKLGRGAALKLNDIFWTAFLAGESTGFFSATHTTAGNTGNSNLNTGAADATISGLTATELLFLNQVGPDGKPLGVMPAIVLAPNAIKATMAALLDPQSKLITGASSTLSDVNVFAGRFRLESSAYMHNTAYTGYSSSAWYMMADPSELSTIEIVALNGRVEPVVESADADFNQLGIQMRGYSDVGVALQEFRACVKADGGAS